MTLIGNAFVTLEVGTPYTDAGATAFDNEDGNLTSSIVTVSNVNTTVLGTYTITYTVKDSSNSTASLTRTVRVTDTTLPTITITGNSEITIQAGSTYTDLGAIATDNYDTNVTIITTNLVNTALIGNYTVTYTAIDSSNNTATASRTVHVISLDDDHDGITNEHDVCPQTTGTPLVDGCSCAQILAFKPGNNAGELKNGCSNGTINVFSQRIGWARDIK